MKESCRYKSVHIWKRVCRFVCVNSEAIRILILTLLSLVTHVRVAPTLKEYYVLDQIIVNKYCTYNKPIPKISHHINTLQNFNSLLFKRRL